MHPSLGDEGAMEFAALYRRQFGFVWSLTAHFGVPSAAREDVAQEVWLTVHRRWDSLRSDASPRAWVASITRRVASRHHRAQQRTQRKLAALEAIDLPRAADGVGPDAFAMIDAALAGMDDGQREVFLLTQVEELSGPEVARILELPLNTVYSRLRLARARLAAALAELAPDEHQIAVALREPEPSRRVSSRVWMVVIGELGLRSSAALVGGGWASKLAITAAAGLAIAAIGTATASAIPGPEVIAPAAAIVPASSARDDAPHTAAMPSPQLERPIDAVTPVLQRSAPTERHRPTRARAAVESSPVVDAPAPVSSTAVDDTAAESKLVGAAMAALRSGDLVTAKRALDRHAAEFPVGKLTIARRAAQARLACASGDAAGARKLATRLVAEHPGDPDAVGVRDVCSAPKNRAPQ